MESLPASLRPHVSVRNIEAVAALSTQALEVLQSQTLPDVMMLGMHLPGVSGEEPYALLKERGEDQRVLLCSADAQLVERYRSLGANALTKPAPVDELQRAIQAIAAG